MQELKWKIHKWDFNPTLAQLQTVGPTHYNVMDVHRGTLVAYVAIRVNRQFNGTTPTASVGDDATVDGFMTAAQAAITAAITAGAGLKNGAGAYLNTTVATNGKLYIIDDTIELVYTGVAVDGGNEVTAGALSVIVVYTELE